MLTSIKNPSDSPTQLWVNGSSLHHHFQRHHHKNHQMSPVTPPSYICLRTWSCQKTNYQSPVTSTTKSNNKCHQALSSWQIFILCRSFCKEIKYDGGFQLTQQRKQGPRLPVAFPAFVVTGLFSPSVIQKDELTPAYYTNPRASSDVPPIPQNQKSKIPQSASEREINQTTQKSRILSPNSPLFGKLSLSIGAQRRYLPATMTLPSERPLVHEVLSRKSNN